MRFTIGHFEIPARDVERAAAFFREAFGWTTTSAPWAGGAYLRLAPGAGPGPSIAGGLLPEGPLVAGQPLLVLHLHDGRLEDSLERIVASGGAVEVAPVVVPGAGRFARFRDPEGNRFGLWEGIAAV